MNELQYRVNFVVSLLQSAITLAVALAVLALVYSHTNELNGWTKPELLCVTGIQIFMPATNANADSTCSARSQSSKVTGRSYDTSLGLVNVTMSLWTRPPAICAS